MARTIKEDALAIGAAMAVVEQGQGDSPEARAVHIEALHSTMRRALYRHRNDLGLSAADVAEIDNHGAVALGGTPKGPPPDPE